MISLDKEYTYQGEKVTVITVTRDHPNYPVVVLVGDDADVMTLTENGDFSTAVGIGDRLIEVAPTQWVNIYGENSVCSHPTRERADEASRGGSRIRLACIEFKNGDGI